MPPDRRRTLLSFFWQLGAPEAGGQGETRSGAPTIKNILLINKNAANHHPVRGISSINFINLTYHFIITNCFTFITLPSTLNLNSNTPLPCIC